MNKVKSFLLTGSILVAAACHDSSLKPNDDAPSVSVATARNCGSMAVLADQLAADPTLQGRMDAIESHTQNFLREGARLVNGKIQIPVVVNVLYNSAAENISDAQIQSQIDVLNEDYHATNSDFSKTPSIFAGVAANYDISFVLIATNRVHTTKTTWKTDDSMKKPNRGGIAPTDPTHNLNLWVVGTMSGGVLGYAQFPGGAAATDGVVIGHNYFGRTGVVSAPYDKGRTATHEVGHWLNLRHIWGDANCGSDLVNDTPTAQTSNFGCPAFPHVSACGTDKHAEMTMNYMDYTDDACMYMFTAGQKARSMAIFAAGGARAAIGQ